MKCEPLLMMFMINILFPFISRNCNHSNNQRTSSWQKVKLQIEKQKQNADEHSHLHRLQQPLAASYLIFRHAEEEKKLHNGRN